MIDTHAHLDFEQYNCDLDKVIENAKANSIEYIVNVGTCLQSSLKSIELAKKYEMIYAAVGIHPHDAGKTGKTADEINNEIHALLKHDKVSAIGEVGLDYYKNLSCSKEQQKLFVYFINIAYKNNMPLIIHNRESDKDMINILETETLSENPGVFHCFSGDKKFAKKILDKGFYVSFTGPITFPKAHELRETAKYIPLDRLLIETDCPFLTPQQFRGKRNEPAYVKYILEKLSEIKNIDFNELDKITTQNAKQLFKI